MSSWHSRMIPPTGVNNTRFKDAELDRVLEEGNVKLGKSERQPLYWRMTEILGREVPTIPLAYWTEMHGVNRHLKGFKGNPTSSRFVWNVKDWSIE
ncbi:hypothetical protein D3C87_1490720 [compost metagenome]